MVKEKKKSTPFERQVSTYRMVCEVLENAKPDGFAARYYAPFFAGELDGSTKWAEKNADQLSKFREWLDGYRWPAGK